MIVDKIDASPTFKMKWVQKQTSWAKASNIVLDNGNRLVVRETPDWKLQTLYNKFGSWVKSRLRYFKGRTVLKSLYSENKTKGV